MFENKLALQLILQFFDYADVVYQNTTKTNLFPLTTAYNKLWQIWYWMFIWYASLYVCMIYLNSFHSIQKAYSLVAIYFQMYTLFASEFDIILFFISFRHSANYFFTPLVKKMFGKKAFRYKAPADLNNLPLNVAIFWLHFICSKKVWFSCFETSCNCFRWYIKGLYLYVLGKY